jgi:hypothetical protein
VEQGRAVIYGVAVADVRGRIDLPWGAPTLIVSVDQIADEDGDHHTVIGYG